MTKSEIITELKQCKGNRAALEAAVKVIELSGCDSCKYLRECDSESDCDTCIYLDDINKASDALRKAGQVE